MAPGQSAAPYRVALTGGIASGKSTVAALFADLGVPVIDTDEIAHALTQRGAPALGRITDALGAEFLDEHGGLDRARLRDRAFADPALRQRLEKILHPLIMQEAARRSAQAAGPYQIIVVPLLFEAGLERDFDRVLVVDCPQTEQLRRLQARDGESIAGAQRILAAQVHRAARLEGADDVIVNDATGAELAERVAALHSHYVQWAGAREK